MTRDEAVNALWRTHTTGEIRFPYLFAILDAAADERIYPKLVSMQDELEVACLFQGEMAEQLATAAPYLVRLDIDLKLFDWWWENGWDQPWGIFAWSPASFEPLYEHFCHHKKVMTEDRQRLLFRFWDPRVLNVALAVFDDQQKREFFGPIQSFAIGSTTEIVFYDACRGTESDPVSTVLSHPQYGSFNPQKDKN